MLLLVSVFSSRVSRFSHKTMTGKVWFWEIAFENVPLVARTINVRCVGFWLLM